MSTRFGYESRADKALLLDFWLTIGRGTGRSDRPSVKVTAGYPALARNERAMRLKMTLPLALFEQPHLEASITVDSPDQAVSLDTTAIAEAVEQVIGMNVDLRVLAPGDA